MKRKINYNKMAKLLFFPIPKTGCTSILNSRKDLFVPQAGHVRAIDVMRAHSMIWQQAYKVTIVRNPWDRLVSAWSYLRDRHSDQGRVSEKFKVVLQQVKECGNFKAFVQWLAAAGVRVDRHFYPQAHWVCLSSRSLMNFVGHFEQLQTDWNTVCARVGLPVEKLLHFRASKHLHYSEVYDDETRAIVAKLYRRDIRQFGYRFRGRKTIKR